MLEVVVEVMCVCLLMLAYLVARICKAEGSRVGFKEGVSRTGGQCTEKGRHRVNRAEAVGRFTRFCICQESKRPKAELIRADFGFLCGVKGYGLRTVLVKVFRGRLVESRPVLSVKVDKAAASCAFCAKEYC